MSERTGHETRDVQARTIGIVAVALVIGGVMIFALIALMFARLDQHFSGTAANRITSGRNMAPAPQLQSDPASDLRRFRAQEDEILTSYGWVDRPAGTVRIPIDRAMELLAQRGLPATPDAAGKTPLEMRQEKAKDLSR